MLSFFLFRALVLARRGFFCRGGRFINLFARFSLFVHSFRWIVFVFFVSTSPLDIMLLIAIHRCISWVSGEFDLYPLISER